MSVISLGWCLHDNSHDPVRRLVRSPPHAARVLPGLRRRPFRRRSLLCRPVALHRLASSHSTHGVQGVLRDRPGLATSHHRRWGLPGGVQRHRDGHLDGDLRCHFVCSRESVSASSRNCGTTLCVVVLCKLLDNLILSHICLRSWNQIQAVWADSGWNRRSCEKEVNALLFLSFIINIKYLYNFQLPYQLK